MKRLLVILAAVLLVGIIFVGCTQEEEPMEAEPQMEGEMMKEEVMNDGSQAPDFTLMTTRGEEVSLSDYDGQKVYVKFWASWCSICLAGLEEIDELAGQMGDFEVITIVSPDFNGEKSKEDFITWYEGLELNNLKVLLDVDGDIARAYGVRAYPTSAYVGSDGILVQALPGHVGNDGIMAKFDSIK